MRLLVLSRGRAVFATNRLVEEAERQGHVVRVVDPATCTPVIGPNGGVRSSTGRLLDRETDVVVARIGSGPLDGGVAVLAEFEARGVAVLNGARGVATARDKWTCLEALAAAGIAVPETALVRGMPQADDAVRAVGGPPWAVKLRHGSGGVGVVLARSRETALAVVQTVLAAGQPVLVQEWVGPRDGGRDLRVVVVDGVAVAAMERSAAPGEARTNVHRGARVRPVPLAEAHAELAVRATEAIGLRFAGVDVVLRPGDGTPVVLEVNASPGIEGIERATGANVAGEAIRAAARIASAAVRHR